MMALELNGRFIALNHNSGVLFALGTENGTYGGTDGLLADAYVIDDDGTVWNTYRGNRRPRRVHGRQHGSTDKISPGKVRRVSR